VGKGRTGSWSSRRCFAPGRPSGRRVPAARRRAGATTPTLARRRFEFGPRWGLPVFFGYALRRGACPTCGVRVETVPWATGKPQLTTT